jgi:hypothetical protein
MVKQYDAIKPDSSSGFSKTLQFLQSYTQTTGDTSLAVAKGFSQEDAEEMATGTLVGTNLGDDTSTSITTVSMADYISGAMAIAQTFKTSASGKYDYSQSAGGYQEWSFDGKSKKTTHRDCSCFVSSMLYAYNYESSYVHRASGSYGCFTDVKSSITTCGDLRSGDILRRPNHVAMVVKVDDTTVYVGDCGTTSSIEKTATQGYAYTYGVDDALKSSWTQVYRP